MTGAAALRADRGPAMRARRIAGPSVRTAQTAPAPPPVRSPAGDVAAGRESPALGPPGPRPGPAAATRVRDGWRSLAVSALIHGTVLASLLLTVQPPAGVLRGGETAVEVDVIVLGPTEQAASEPTPGDAASSPTPAAIRPSDAPPDAVVEPADAATATVETPPPGPVARPVAEDAAEAEVTAEMKAKAEMKAEAEVPRPVEPLVAPPPDLPPVDIPMADAAPRSEDPAPEPSVVEPSVAEPSVVEPSVIPAAEPAPPAATASPPPVSVGPAPPPDPLPPAPVPARATPSAGPAPQATATRQRPSRPRAVPADTRRGAAGRGDAVARHAASQVGGTGGAAPEAGTAEIATYRARVLAHLARHKLYPAAARDRGVEGRATLSFVLSRDGAVVSSALSEGSGAAILDEATLSMLRRAAPFPPMPDGGPATMSFRTAVRYDLRS